MKIEKTSTGYGQTAQRMLEYSSSDVSQEYEAMHAEESHQSRCREVRIIDVALKKMWVIREHRVFELV